VATAGYDGDLRLLEPTGALVEQLPWHAASVNGLAWAGDALVSGDSQGRVAVWEPTSPARNRVL
jgi:hypothetical protein